MRSLAWRGTSTDRLELELYGDGAALEAGRARGEGPPHAGRPPQGRTALHPHDGATEGAPY